LILISIMKYCPLRKGIGAVLEKSLITNVHNTVDTVSVLFAYCSVRGLAHVFVI